jgi:hypothetical protein
MARSALEMNTARAASRRERKKNRRVAKTKPTVKSKNSQGSPNLGENFAEFPIRSHEGD